MASKRGRLTNKSRDADGNPLDYDQTIKGERIYIKYGESIEKPWRDCINIRGHYAQVDGKDVRVTLVLEEVPESGPVQEQPQAETFESKMAAKFEEMDAKIAAIAQPQEKVKLFACHLCDREFTKKTALINHIKACKGGVDDTGNSSKLSKDNV
jgi:hypothetical protein